MIPRLYSLPCSHLFPEELEEENYINFIFQIGGINIIPGLVAPERLKEEL